ncbi:acyl-CoA dehydrogenase family protein [Herbiconiux daphne]|uniref:Acyl-CoA dehydrogenase family protein n=1 Tax=Herbiconiux daphne TaxID=2970914 RepID=A0ABT2H5J7_9MICO|nr:acyl-CoA dehydrogenase family protein [Herbiconiux daphne]MCS5735168.1 acyl-CoA dehydrogenase family protein [Herbiconiux daphne]
MSVPENQNQNQNQNMNQNPNEHTTVTAPGDLLERTRAFIRDVVIPAEPEPGTSVDSAVLARLQAEARDAGVYAPHAPAEYGGQGLSIAAWSPVFQAAGYSPIGPSALGCMAPDEGNAHMLEKIASPAQKKAYLAPLVRGDVRSAFAMTEPHPGAGSDPEALLTTATAVDGGWRIDGDKRFISGARGAGFFIVMARTEHGATMFLVDADNPGLTLGRDIHTIDRAIAGGHSYVHFDDCRVGDDAVLGAPHEGFRYAQVRLGPARLTHCMRWLGLARRSLDIALDRAESRELFGARLRDLGLAQGLIADSVIDIETSDAIITATAEALERDPREGARLSSIAKVHCSEAIFRVIDRSMQLCGGDGVSSDLPLASYLDEVRPFRIYDGANETHRWAISRRASSTRRRELADVGAIERPEA